MTRYEHTQIGKIMICALLGAAAVAGMGAIMRGDSIAILLLTITGFYKLTVKIDNEKLRVSFGIGLIRKEVSISEIASCAPIRIRWWYGWGIHFTPSAGSTTFRVGTQLRSRCEMDENSR